MSGIISLKLITKELINPASQSEILNADANVLFQRAVFSKPG